MRIGQRFRAPRGLRLSAIGVLLFLHLPLLLIFVYAFTTEDKSYQWPPPELVRPRPVTNVVAVVVIAVTFVPILLAYYLSRETVHIGGSGK